MANYALMNPGKYHLGEWNSEPPYFKRKYIKLLEPFKNVQFKTSILHNRRIYVGNVKVTYQDGTVETMGDTMYRSEPNQFDKFTMRGKIEVAVGDGEDIIKLESYADRILQYKNKTLHIINASGKQEFLEDSYKFKGVKNPQAVARTDYGVAWANEFGCYLYDGREIHDILEEGTIRKIKQSTWSSFVTDNTMVGYSPTKRQIIVVDSFKASESSGNIFLYDIPTRSWVKGLARVSGNNKSNFFIDQTSSALSYLQNDGFAVKLEQWSDTSAVGAIDLRMRDEDLGNPHVKKKLKKVYITSKKAQGITVSGAINGSGNFGDVTFNTNALHTGNAWDKTEHKITNTTQDDVYSIQLKFSGTAANADFEVNDISIIYRGKSIK